MIKFSNKKNIIKIAAIVFLAAVIIVMNSSFAEANNHQDEPWSFETGLYGGTGLIVESGRNKTDTSSVYIYCNERIDFSGAKGSSFSATAYGSNTAKTGYINCVYNGKSSKTYFIQKGTTQFMINYIREAGYGYANIHYDAIYNANTKFSGVWSPDSI